MVCDLHQLLIILSDDIPVNEAEHLMKTISCFRKLERHPNIVETFQVGNGKPICEVMDHPFSCDIVRQIQCNSDK